MKQIVRSNRFKRDLKLIIKRGYDIKKLEDIIMILSGEESLPKKFHPHKLSGNYMGFWECHIEPDWLLIYDVGDDFLDLARTGTHSDLFR